MQLGMVKQVGGADMEDDTMPAFIEYPPLSRTKVFAGIEAAREVAVDARGMVVQFLRDLFCAFFLDCDRSRVEA